jgi:hypothetical protein
MLAARVERERAATDLDLGREGARCVLDPGIEEMSLLMGDPEAPLDARCLADALESAIPRVLLIFGSIMKLVLRNDEGNLSKIHSSLRNAAGSGCESVEDLLRYELSEGMHTPHDASSGKSATLKDASAAMGLTWLCRTLEFASTILQNILAAEHAQRSIPDAIREAYARVLERYHGPVMRNIFKTGPARAPVYEELLWRFAPDTNRADREAFVQIKMKQYVRACAPVISAIKAKLSEAGLEDTRKTW